MGPSSRCSAVLLAVLFGCCAAEDPDQDAMNAAVLQYLNSPEGVGALQAVGGDSAAAEAEKSSAANTEAAVSSAFMQLEAVKTTVQKIRDDEKQRVVRVRDNVKFRQEMLKLLRSSYDELATDNKALSSKVTSLSKNKDGQAAQPPVPSATVASVSASGETVSETVPQTEASDSSDEDVAVAPVSLVQQAAIKRTNKEIGAQAMKSVDVLSGQMTALRSKDEAEISALTTHSSERRKLEKKIKEQHEMLKADLASAMPFACWA